METLTQRGLRKRKLYRGMSSYNYMISRSHFVYDVECVKHDLINHIFTRRGSRLMMPTFGTIIPDLVMEQLDDYTIDEIETELRAVVEYDPRVELLNERSLVITADPDNNAVVAAIRLRYIELDYVDTLNIHIQFGE